MATEVAILGRGEFCKVVGEGLLPVFYPVLISLPVFRIIYIERTFLLNIFSVKININIK